MSSLSGAFQIGRSGLAAAQLGIQTAGNNAANAATPGYSRQVVTQVPVRDVASGSVFVGRGVEVSAIRRQVDSALQSRLLNGVSGENSAKTDARVLSQVEATLGALTDNDLQSHLGAFFDSWSELANSPTDSAARALVIEKGAALADRFKTLRSGLSDQRAQVDKDLLANVNEANDLLGQIAGLNATIVQAENGQGSASGLRDQRDALVGKLAALVDVSTVEQPNGNLDVFVGSTPLVLAGQSRGVSLVNEVVNGEVQVSVVASDKQEKLDVSAGAIGSLLKNRSGTIDASIDQLDTLAANLIDEVNAIHASGSGPGGAASYTSALVVPLGDTTKSFNDPANGTFAALNRRPVSGSFDVTITNSATGAATTKRITLDLDGIDSTNAPGFANDTTLASLAASINAALGASGSASLNPSGQLTISATSGNTVRLSEDTSGVLGVLRLNTYFTGKTAADIGVSSALRANSSLLSTARVTGGQPSDNGTALAIAALRTGKISGLNGQTFTTAWDATTSSIGVATSAAKTASDAASVVRENLDAQRQAVSGVSIDEETINLLNYQRQYQASARFISVVDELTQTLLGIAR